MYREHMLLLVYVPEGIIYCRMYRERIMLLLYIPGGHNVAVFFFYWMHLRTSSLMAFLKIALSGPTWSDCGHTLWRLYLHIYTCYQPTGISHSAVILKE